MKSKKANCPTILRERKNKELVGKCLQIMANQIAPHAPADVHSVMILRGWEVYANKAFKVKNIYGYVYTTMTTKYYEIKKKEFNTPKDISYEKLIEQSNFDIADPDWESAFCADNDF